MHNINKEIVKQPKVIKQQQDLCRNHNKQQRDKFVQNKNVQGGHKPYKDKILIIKINNVNLIILVKIKNLLIFLL